MTPKKTYPRPEGRTIRSNQECPLCKAPPGVAHKAKCPWELWARSPAPSTGTEPEA